MLRHHARLALLSCCASLTACYAQVESDSVHVARELCKPAQGCLPGGGVPLTALPVAGSPTFDVDLGPLAPAAGGSGPLHLRTQARLLAASLAVTASPGATLDGIQTLELVQVLGADATCAAAGSCRTVARYDRAVDGPADRELALRAPGLDLLDPARPDGRLVFRLRASGTAPVPATWAAAVGLELGLKARATLQ